MNGNEFCKILASAMEASTDSMLADVLGVTPAAISNLRKKEEISSRQSSNYIKRIVGAKKSEILNAAIKPVVEYFPINATQKRSEKRWYFIDEDKNDHLLKVLKSNIGIYSFYDSQGKIIYLGKTKKNLYDEMVQTYNRDFRQYFMYSIHHPREKFRPNVDGKLHDLTRMSVILADTAIFFSAYVVDSELVDALEAFLIRISANNLINSRMETKLTAVGSPIQGG